YRNAYANFNTVAAASFVPSVAASNNIFLVWERLGNIDPLVPGVASQGLVVGRSIQAVAPGPGQTEPTFVPMGGVTAWIGSSDTPGQSVAITSDSCGQFTIFDPKLGGGPRAIKAKASINGQDVILHG